MSVDCLSTSQSFMDGWIIDERNYRWYSCPCESRVSIYLPLSNGWCDSLDLPSLFFRTFICICFGFGVLNQFKWTWTLGPTLDFHPSDPSTSNSPFLLWKTPTKAQGIFFIKEKYSFSSLKITSEKYAPKQPLDFLLQKSWINSQIFFEP